MRLAHLLVREAARDGGDASLHHVDGSSLFGPADTDHPPDGVHPGAIGYRRTGERFHAAMPAPGGPLAAALRC